jgi:hypothetical protein
MKLGDKIAGYQINMEDSAIVSCYQKTHFTALRETEQITATASLTLKMANKITGCCNMEKGRNLINSKEREVSNSIKISKRKTYSLILFYIMPCHGHV